PVAGIFHPRRRTRLHAARPYRTAGARSGEVAGIGPVAAGAGIAASFELGIISAEDRAGKVALYVGHRGRYSVAVGRRDDLEIAAPHCVEPGAGGRHPLRDLDADFLPFIDQPSADIFIGLIDVAVQQLEAEPLGAGLFQQLLRFGARLLDVGPEAGDLLQLVLGGGQRRAWQDDAADGMYVGNFGQSGYAVPAVDCQGQRPPHSHVVKRLSLVVCLDEAAAVPIAFLLGYLVAKLGLQIVARRRRHAAEFDRGTVAAQRVDPRRLLLGEDAFESVEIGQARVVIIGVAHPVDRLTGLVGGELKGPRPFDVLLVPAWVRFKGAL